MDIPTFPLPELLFAELCTGHVLMCPTPFVLCASSYILFPQPTSTTSEFEFFFQELCY